MTKKNALAIVIALAVLAYANAFRNGFALDDVPIIAENPVVRSVGNVGTIFGTNYWSRGGTASLGDPTLYRPLTVFSYAVDYAIWNLQPSGFHATNIVLHAATTALVFLLAAELLGSVVGAFAAASIFAVHPVHTEAVTGVVGRAEVMATLFFVAAFLVMRYRPPTPTTRKAKREATPGVRGHSRAAIGALLYLLGLFSKETAITFPAVMAVDDWLRRNDLPPERRPSVSMLALRYGPLAIAAAIYFACRHAAIGGSPEIWPGFVGVSTGARVLTASRVLLEYIGLFLVPRTLLPDYWKTSVPIATLGDPLALVSFVSWIGLAVLVFRERRRNDALVLAIAWFFITIAPVSNVFFAIGVAKAERILYLPSVGVCLVAGWAYTRVAPRLHAKWIPMAVLAAVLVAFAARTLVRNKDWRDNFTLATAALAASPGSPLMSDIAAGELMKRGDAASAQGLLRDAVQQAPDMPLIRTHLGIVYYSRGQLDQAIVEYREALRRRPNDAEAHNNLGVAYAAQGQLDSAVASYREALRLRPDYADAQANLAAVEAARASRGTSRP